MAAEAPERLNEVIARQYAPTRWDQSVSPRSARVSRIFPTKLADSDQPPQRLSIILNGADPGEDPYINFCPVRAVFLHKIPGHGYKLIIAYPLGDQSGFTAIPFSSVTKMEFSDEPSPLEPQVDH